MGEVDIRINQGVDDDRTKHIFDYDSQSRRSPSTTRARFDRVTKTHIQKYFVSEETILLFAGHRLTAAIADGCAANCRKRLSKAALTFTMRVFYDTSLVRKQNRK